MPPKVGWDLGVEDPTAAARRVYVVTFARLLPGTPHAVGLQDVEGLTRADILHAVRDAWLNPIAPAGHAGNSGRRREQPGDLVLKIAVFQEFHGDGLQRRTAWLHVHMVCAACWPRLKESPY
jgi:hypothetical protein